MSEYYVLEAGGNAMFSNLETILSRIRISASAPTRLDCGGTWDIRALAVAEPHTRPSTVNIALDVPARVVLHPFSSEYVAVGSARNLQKAHVTRLPLNGPWGIIFGIASHFAVSGVRFHVECDAPAGSGLGGSGALAVAAVSALSQAVSVYKQTAEPISRQKVAIRAHAVEEGMGYSICGLQDHLAAAFGGVNQWLWQYDVPQKPYARRQLLSASASRNLADNILVAFTGVTRPSSAATVALANSFYNRRTRAIWRDISHLVDAFAESIIIEQWRAAGAILSQETILRNKLLPCRRSSLISRLFRLANDAGCGFAISGGNQHGCVWALGEAPDIVALKQRWTSTLEHVVHAALLPTNINVAGVSVQDMPRVLRG